MSGWQPNDAGQHEWLVSGQAFAAVRPFAERIKVNAVALSPVGPEKDSDLTHYAQAWGVRENVRLGEGKPRARAQVENSSDYAASVEYGNGRTDPPHRARKTIDAHHVLARAIEASREL